MSKAVFSDFRRDNNDSFKEPLSASKDKLSSSDHDVSQRANNISLHKLRNPADDERNNVGSVDQNGRAVKFRERLASDRRRPFEGQRQLQNYCYKFLEQPSGWHNIYHGALILLVLASLVMAVLSTVGTKDIQYADVLRSHIFILEIVLVLVFMLEYVVRVWSAGCCSIYVGIKGRLRFALKIYAILDMTVIISSILALVLATSRVSESSLEILRFLPLLRVLRFDRQGGTWKMLGSVIYAHRKEMLTAVYLGFISLIFASFVMYLSEKHLSDDFNTWPESFWWGIVTLTTVGYGDKVPQTWHGKLLAAIFAVCGISFFALPAGILGSGFALNVTQQQRQKHFHRRRRPAAVLLQSYWRLYCADINSKSVATWLPHIYYNRQQEALQMFTRRGSQHGQTGQTSLTVPESPDATSPHKRKRSLRGSRPKNDARGGRSDSMVASVLGGSRKVSTSTLESEFLDVCKTSLCGSSEAIVTLAVPGPANSNCTVVYPKKQVKRNSFNDDESNFTVPGDGEMPIITLTNAQKHAICLVRLLKLLVAIRKFKEARRPYDVKDVMEQYASGHVEMLSRIKSLQMKLDKSVGINGEPGLGYKPAKGSVMGRLVQVEHQVQTLDHKLDKILQILQTRPTNPCCSSMRGFGDGNSGDGNSHASVQRTYSDPSEVDLRVSVASDDVPWVSSRTQARSASVSDGTSSRGSLLSQTGANGTEGIDELDSRLEGLEDAADNESNPSLDDKQSSALGRTKRQGLLDKRQLSDVSEEADSREHSPKISRDNSSHSLRKEPHENVEVNEDALVLQKRTDDERSPLGENYPQRLPDHEPLSGDISGRGSQEGPNGGSLEEAPNVVDKDQSVNQTRSASAKRQTLLKSQPITV